MAREPQGLKIVNVLFKEKVATVLSLNSLPEGPGGACKVWREGKIHDELITFDAEGWGLIYQAMGGSINLEPVAVLLNMKLQLNQLLRSWNFEEYGPVHFDRNMAQRWISLG